MESATWTLLVLGLLGAADIAIYHTIAHGIRSHRDSAAELVTHAWRGPTYAALFLLVPNFQLHGLFALLLLALLGFDVAISIWDFSLESTSRRALGGLPSGEYVLHMVMAMIFGGLIFNLAPLLYVNLDKSTSLAYLPAAVPDWIRALMAVMAILVLISGIQDALAAIRLKRRPRVNVDSTAIDWPIERRAEPIQFDPSSKATICAPAWMSVVLILAGIYNLAWGAWVVLFPAAMFQLAAMPPNNYPQIWQGMGMVIGVYGIGYLIAAANPRQHWPIVLVGLLGKVLGPIGVAYALTQGTLPLKFAAACITNDLVWWVPFTLIVFFALRNRFLVTHKNGLTISKPS